MKIVLFGILVVLAQLSMQKPRIDGDCTYAMDYLKPYINGCYEIRCTEGSEWGAVLPCGLVQGYCPENQTYIEKRGDPEKLYPECCLQTYCVE